MGHKVLIIGLDGGTWDLLDPMIERGVMPTLGALKSGGVAAKLTSTIPPITPCAWTTFQTGVGPGRHGIFGFTSFDKCTHELSLVNARAVRFPTLWELASRAGKRVASINVPMTYPPRPVNGATITGMLTPSDKVQFTYPAELADELKERFGPYLFVAGQNRRHAVRHATNYTDAMISVVRFRTKVARWLLDQENWDLFMVHFQAVDAYQHVMWPYLVDPSLAPERYALGVAFYRAVDEAIREVSESASADLGFIMSDHGFQHRRRNVFLNNWLRKRGYLVMREESARARMGGWLFSAIRRVDRLNLRNRLVNRHDKVRLLRLESSLSIDWERTRFHARGSMGMPCAFLYSRGGAEARSDGVTDRLCDQLGSIIDAQTGQPFIEWVRPAIELYGADGPTVPDFVVKLRPGYTALPRMSPELFADVRRDASEAMGTHHVDGILLAWGDAIAEHASLRGAHIVDLCPTLLFALGVAPPNGLDGTALTHILKYTAQSDFPIDSEQGIPGPVASVEPDHSIEQDQSVLKRLRDLGYLDE